ncbi:hypothetical protein V6N13_021472 [Hibiscus sabdariffa]|uniref:Uncharacterized protein n=1 Tax=Hibiscus sabdariffa TaxID=183260 RepID=A0ABR2NPK0_9ROSI
MSADALQCMACYTSESIFVTCIQHGNGCLADSSPKCINQTYEASKFSSSTLYHNASAVYPRLTGLDFFPLASLGSGQYLLSRSSKVSKNELFGILRSTDQLVIQSPGAVCLTMP